MQDSDTESYPTPPPNPRITLRDLWDQIVEDWRTHDRDWTIPGFRAVALHRLGVWRMQLQPRILRAPFSFVYKFLFRYIRNHYGIELPYTVRLGRRVVIEHQHGIVIHGYAVIGDDCIIRHGVTIGNRHMDRPRDAPKLGSRVNIGVGATLLGAITIGDDVNVGANSVVLSSVSSNQTVAGMPARPVKSAVVVPKQEMNRRLSA
jgi:serine acetyltransferase